MNDFEFGIYSLGERIPDNVGNRQSAVGRIEDILTIARWADEAGLDVFGLGEHHRLDFVTSSHAMLLAAVARETKNIKLTSAVSVISTSDPVRLFEDFSTLDLLSDGRAEVVLGRGAFVESFSLFGENLSDYDTLFEEKLELFMQLQQEERVYWSGRFRSPLRNAQISPRPVQERIPVWVGVGGTPMSAYRAGRLGLNMALGILGGRPEMIKPLVNIYWEAAQQAGHDISKLRVSVNGHSHIADTGEQAVKEFLPHYNRYLEYFAKDRGQQFSETQHIHLALQRSKDQILALGSADEIAEKIIYQHKLFGHSRFMGQIDLGGMPLSKVEKTIDLLANRVAPLVRREISTPTYS